MLVHDRCPKIPSATTSVPTRRIAAVINPAAPPGNFLIVLDGFPENFQTKTANKIWARRNARPASRMVMDICRSIAAPVAEISSGIQGWATSKTAEPIATRSNVMANSLAMDGFQRGSPLYRRLRREDGEENGGAGENRTHV